MIRGIYNAASAMVARARQHDVTASNLANAGTAGYKRQSIFLRRLDDAQRPDEPAWMSKLDEGTYTDFSQGMLEPTGDALNVALDGPGYFVVSTPEGERYTRNGNFTCSDTGELTTPDGLKVMSDSGALVLPAGQLVVGESGEIYVDGTQVGRMRIVTFNDQQRLKPTGKSLYASTDAAVPATSTAVRQGYLERSNLDVVREMVQMITQFRYYETAQKAVQMQDETLNQAVNQIGKLSRS
jgi:flagellar basal-body rod protein FlgG